LGGEPGSDDSPGFRILTGVGQRRLAGFLGWVRQQGSGDHEVHLVINGDFVDFLAEKEFAPFTPTDEAATDKLRRVMSRTAAVWDGLHEAVSAGVRMTILLGNHDIELSLPGPRRLLLERLGHGSVDFIYDNQAFVAGPVLIEHGNRYDNWNAVRHDQLRELRSALSRREPPPEFPPPAGSQLVQQVMNPLKAHFPFVDLLKPENAGAIPMLAVLDPSSMRAVPKIAQLARQSARVRFDATGRPLDPSNIAEEPEVRKDRELLQLAANLAAGGDAQQVSFVSRAGDLWNRLRTATSQAARAKEFDLLYRGIRAHIEEHRQNFDVNREDERYLRAAQVAVRRGFRVVVFGHTHAVKRVPLDSSGNPAGPKDDPLSNGGAVYLNTGTWADLMRFPEAVLNGKEEEGRAQLERFSDDLEANRTDRYREQIPTFARIEIEGQQVKSADVYLFSEPEEPAPVPNGQLASLIYTP
jgi:UDP-2,3-diacylglucosamine pyrophosphatase LpxH